MSAAQEPEADIDFEWDEPAQDEVPEEQAAADAPPNLAAALDEAFEEEGDDADEDAEHVKGGDDGGGDAEGGGGEDDEVAADDDEAMADVEGTQEGGGAGASTSQPSSRTHAPATEAGINAIIERRKRTMGALTQPQLDRYESFRRSSLARPKIKKVMQSLLGYPPTNDSVISMGGMCKILVGELVEAARELASAEGYTGPLLPKHIHYAYQNMNLQQKLPHHKQTHKRLFK